MVYTAAEAAKQLKILNAKKETLLQKESINSTFVAATIEDPEALRPDYDYAKTQADLDKLDEQIRRLKHAIAVFNTTTVVEEFNMTVDQILIYLPQLNNKCEKLNSLRMIPRKARDPFSAHAGNIIDYKYANFDPDKAAEDYIKTTELIARVQTALDIVNNTGTIDIDL